MSLRGHYRDQFYSALMLLVDGNCFPAQIFKSAQYKFQIDNFMQHTDYGLTMAKFLILGGPNSNPNAKILFGIRI